MLKRGYARALIALVVSVIGVSAVVGTRAVLGDEQRAEPPDSSASAPTASPASEEEPPAENSSATTLCIDSTIPGAALRVSATIARLQPALASAHKQVGGGYAAAGGKPWERYVRIEPAIRCPHGTPTLTLPADGRLLRDGAVRPPVDSRSAYQLKLFVLPDEEADGLFPGKDYLRMPYEQVCDARGGSCGEVSTALFIANRNAANDRVVFDSVIDGLGFRQALVYPNGHPASEDGNTKPPK